jgi:hypothetical protein
MCRRVDCPRCGRPTFAGCGRHVEQVLGDVPPAERCRCGEAQAKTSGVTSGGRPGGDLRALLRSLFGR